MIDLNKVTIGIMSGMAGGIAVGIGARIAMRFVALISTGTGSFTFGGTMAILMFGVIIGAPFGALFAMLKRFVPLPGAWQGLVFGAALTAIFVAPPFLLASPEGEAAIVAPWIGFGLFAPLPLIYGLAIGALSAWAEGKYLSRMPERNVGFLWPVLWGGAIFAMLIGLVSFGEFFPSPPAITLAMRDLHIPFSTYKSVGIVVQLIFIVVYVGLSVIIVWQCWHDRMAKFTALALLLFGAAFFNNGQDQAGLTNVLMTGLKAASLIGLLILLYIFPDGQFSPGWTRWLAIAGSIWLAVWLFAPVAWPDPLAFVMTAAFLGAGLYAQFARYRQAEDSQRRQQGRWAVIGFGGAVAAFVLIWALTILVPDFKARADGISVVFAYTLYALPWLFIPLAIVFAMRRDRLWEAKAT